MIPDKIYIYMIEYDIIQQRSSSWVIKTLDITVIQHDKSDQKNHMYLYRDTVQIQYDKSCTL